MSIAGIRGKKVDSPKFYYHFYYKNHSCMQPMWEKQKFDFDFELMFGTIDTEKVI